ncbi:hypothetical protein OMAG_002732, partial [Candidatus Omnitrophus magneticus]
NGIDTDLFNSVNVRSAYLLENLKLSKEPVIIGIIGLFIELKGHMVLLKSLLKIKKEIKRPFICVLVGDGTEE